MNIQSESEYAVSVYNLTVVYNSFVALKNVNLKMFNGEFLAIMGPNGAGKTTLLKVILGLLKPQNGKVKVYGYDPFKNGDRVRSLIGYVPQKINVANASKITVGEIVLMGILARKTPPRIPSKKDYELAIEALKIVGMEEFWDRSFSELSGGQQQRVLIARALTKRPKLLLLDEPLTGLDVKSQGETASFLYELNKHHNVSILIVTHDINPIAEYINRVAILHKSIIALGPPEEVLKEDILSKVYGGRIKVFTYGKACFAIIGDVHHRR